MGFSLKQSGKRRYLAENIVDTYYTDDLAVLWQNRRCRDPTAQIKQAAVTMAYT